MPNVLTIDNISCRYEPKNELPPVIEQLSFSLKDGEIGCLLGSSGCGKTTVLRCIAGFQSIDDGHIKLDNRTLSHSSFHMAPEKRQVGMVFQDYALFPHLTVCENVTFGLRNMSADAKESICDELLQLVKLTDLGHRYPHKLSGGQQQRVALARALAPAPKLLLFDEPFSSLDTELRRSLALEVRGILKSRGTSAIMVTHDQEEAFAFADKVGVLNNGRLEQWDVPFNLYHEPNTRYVANFIGQGVFLPGFMGTESTIGTELGLLKSHKPYPLPKNSAVEVLIRPDDIIEDSESRYRARITQKLFAGTSTLYTLVLPTGSSIEAALPSHHNFDVGQEIGVSVAADHIIVFSHDQARILPETI